MERRVRHCQGAKSNVEKGRPGMWAGDIPLGGTPFPDEGAGEVGRDSRAEPLITGLTPGRQRPRRADHGGTLVVQVRDPVGGSHRDSQALPACVHRLLRHRVEGPSDVPAGEKKGRVGAPGVFEAVKMDHQGRVGAMSPPKPVLAGREGPVNLPEVMLGQSRHPGYWEGS